MLQTMRHWAQSWVFKGLMLMLIVSFGIWGIGDIFHGNTLQRTVAKAGSTTISVQELNHEFEQQIIQARQLLGQSLTSQQARQIGMLEKSLDAIIIRTLVDQQAHNFNIDVNSKILVNEVASLPQFRDKDGKFNLPLFRQLITQQHLSEHDFFERGRQEMIRRQLIDLMQDHSKTSDLIVDTLIRAREQKRFFDIVEIDNNSMNSVPSPDDKDLETYWQKNPQLFTSPEYRGITIALLTEDNIAKSIHITDDQVKQEFVKKAAELVKPERRDILQVLVHDEAQANKVSEEAKASGSLEKAAKGSNHDTVSLNQIDKKSLLPELANPVFSLQNEQISKPIRSTLGWHIVQIKKISPGGNEKYDDIKDQLREAMKHEQIVDTLTRTVNQLDDELAAGHTLEDIADSLKLQLIKLPLVDAAGKTSDGKEPSEFPNKEDVLKTAYAQNSGESSPVMEDKKGSYFVVRTDDLVPSSIIAFNKIKTSVATEWKKSAQAAHAVDEAEKIAKLIREGKKPESFSSNGITTHISKGISIADDQDPSLPTTILPQVMKIKKGEVITTSSPGKQIVIRLNKIVDADITENKTARPKILSELSHNIPNEIVEEYVQHLKQVFPVKIYTDVLETIKQQGS